MSDLTDGNQDLGVYEKKDAEEPKKTEAEAEPQKSAKADKVVPEGVTFED